MNCREGDAKGNESPRTTARVAAREKLSTVVIEMTVDARQRFKALNISDVDPSFREEGFAGMRARRPNGDNNRSPYLAKIGLNGELAIR
jgi:hypothetical protein